MWSPKFSSISDTLIYNSQTERFQLIHEPKAWHDDIQLTGPFISVQLDSSEIKRLKSYTKTIAVQEDSATGRHHQIKGDTLTAFFENSEISRIVIQPNSQVLYHTTNEAGDPDGAVEYTSPKTTMYFKNGSLQRVVAGQNQGYFLPEFEGLKERRLDGYAWNPELRPQKPSKQVQPKWPAIPRKRPFELPRRFEEFEEEEGNLEIRK